MVSPGLSVLLHDRGLVFSDLREANPLYFPMTKSFLLIDFVKTG